MPGKVMTRQYYQDSFEETIKKANRKTASATQ
jgi:hypothetical protein